MNKRIVVVGIIKKDNQILLGQKTPKTGPYPDTWHIPGGGVNLENEDTEKALKREIKEETNLTVTNLKKVAWDTDIEPNKHGEKTYYIFLQYTCNYKKGELKAGDDKHKFKWVNIKNLSGYNLNKPKKVLEKLEMYN